MPSVQLPPALDRVLRDYEAGWKAKDGKGLAGGDGHLRALGYSTADTVGYIVGGYGYAPNTGDVGKFVLAVRKGSDGRWLIAADIDNGNGRRG